MTTQGIWTVSRTAALWYKIEPLSGTGNATLTISPQDSYREIRENQLIRIVSGNGSATITIKPTQANQPPATAALVVPADGATGISTSAFFQWQEAIDPDGDKVTYQLEYSTDQSDWKTVSADRIGANTGCSLYTIPLAANTKYYWRVKALDMFDASTVSAVSSFTTGSNSGSWADGEVRVYQENTVGGDDVWTLIVTGDGFTAADLVNGGDWEQVSARAIEGLFSVEPYKSYRGYIRVLRIGAESQEQGVSNKPGGTNGVCTVKKNTRFGTMYDTQNSAWCGLYFQGDYQSINYWPATGHPGKTIDDADALIRNWVIPTYIASDAKMNNVAMLIIMNAQVYNGTVNYYGTANTTMGFVTRSPGIPGTQTGFENVVVHEIGGHGIAHLADEYISTTGALSAAKKTQTLEFQSRGFYENVDVSGSRERCPWAHFFTAPEYKAYYSMVGYIEGARSSATGIWRAEPSSCMVRNEFYFNGPQREAIVKRLRRAAEETHTWAEFVAKDYVRSANTGSRSILEFDPNFVPLPEPRVGNISQ